MLAALRNERVSRGMLLCAGEGRCDNRSTCSHLQNVLNQAASGLSEPSHRALASGQGKICQWNGGCNRNSGALRLPISRGHGCTGDPSARCSSQKAGWHRSIRSGAHLVAKHFAGAHKQSALLEQRAVQQDECTWGLTTQQPGQGDCGHGRHRAGANDRAD